MVKPRIRRIGCDQGWTIRPAAHAAHGEADWSVTASLPPLDLKTSLDATADNLRAGINAEDSRARLAEKRRVYSAFLAAVDKLTMEILQRAVSGKKSPSMFGPGTVPTAMLKALGDLELIAPANISQLANEIRGMLVGEAAKIEIGLQDHDAAPTGVKKDEVLKAMRADTGETD
jgi:hypothetical protein